MDIGKSIIFLGFSLICVGCFFYLLGDRMNWFGNLLGDFKYESKNIRVYMPLASMLILSVFLTITINVILKYFK